MLKNKILAASNDATDYYILLGEGEERVGILAQRNNDESNACLVEELFFTKEEAMRCCVYLAVNDVYPAVLRDVLADTYYAY